MVGGGTQASSLSGGSSSHQSGDERGWLLSGAGLSGAGHFSEEALKRFFAIGLFLESASES